MSEPLTCKDLIEANLDVREFLDTIVASLEDAKERSRSDPDPVIPAKAIAGARRALGVFAEYGFPQLRPYAELMREGCENLRHLFLKEIVRRLLVDEISEAKAGEALRLLQSLVDSGQWESYKEDVDAVEAKLNEADAALQQRA